MACAGGVCPGSRLRCSTPVLLRRKERKEERKTPVLLHPCIHPAVPGGAGRRPLTSARIGSRWWRRRQRRRRRGTAGGRLGAAGGRWKALSSHSSAAFLLLPHTCKQYPHCGSLRQTSTQHWQLARERQAKCIETARVSCDPDVETARTASFPRGQLQVAHPRWVRVNTLKGGVDCALTELRGWATDKRAGGAAAGGDAQGRAGQAGGGGPRRT